MVAVHNHTRINMKKNLLALKTLIIILILAHLLSSEPNVINAQNLKIHPVILIHGINASFDDWRNNPNGIYYTLQADSYDMRFVLEFAYPPGEINEDSDGDIYAIAQKLDQEIENLSQQSLLAGGPAQVDIVAHSLGGIITRQYLSQNLTDHKIGKFIDIGTPHSGSAWIDVYNGGVEILADQIVEPLGISSLPSIFQDLVEQAINAVVERAWESFNINTILPNPGSPAAQQMDPDSTFIHALNQPDLSPEDVRYDMIYGDITGRFQFNIFGYQVLSQELISFGDIAVNRENAATIPYLGTRLGPNPPNYNTHQFEKSVTLQVTQELLLPTFSFPNLDQAIQEATTVWHSGLLSNQEVNQLILQILNDGFQSGPSPTSISTGSPPLVTPLPIGGNASTVMVFDTSGSMNLLDQTGIMKIEAAKRAGNSILDILQAEAELSSGFTGEVGLVRFSNTISLELPLTNNIADARSVLKRFFANGGTRMAGGLRIGIDTLSQTGGQVRSILILLSDGLPNIMLSGEGRGDYDPLVRQEVLALASEAGRSGICVYTVGFGEFLAGGGSIDEDLLRQIANTSGCGEYYNAQDATQLANVYVELRHISTGNILLNQSGIVAQDQEVDIGTVDIPGYQSQILFTLNWPGSKLEPILIDPNDQPVDENYPGASVSSYNSLASIIIKEPMEGLWQVGAKGVDVPEGNTTYNAILSARPSPATPTPTQEPATPTPEPVVPTSSGLPVAVVILVLGGGAIGIYVLAQTANRKRGISRRVIQTGNIQLIGRSGEVRGHNYPLTDGILIGRGTNCQIRLSEQTVSRQHARLRLSQGSWFIQDLGSNQGTFVNDKRVSAATLRNGDRIRIGRSEFEFVL